MENDKEWTCIDCENHKYLKCSCGNKICTVCGCIDECK